ncbi:MAG: ABC transporter ATP-binding protein [Candidatus Methanomethylicaceae archaeon]
MKNISKAFGGIGALKDVSMSVNSGEIVGIIGPNGAGKTTLFGVISGFHRPDRGSVLFNGKRIDGLPPHKICKMGIARTFQIAQPFNEFTVYNTALTAALCRLSMRDAKKKAWEVLEVVGLNKKAHDLVSTLTIAEQKALEITKAVSTGACLVLLDEVMAGLTSIESELMIKAIRALNEEWACTFLIVEHVMPVIMKLCKRVVVLNFGVVIAEGPPEAVTGNRAVIDSYLGEEVELET